MTGSRWSWLVGGAALLAAVLLCSGCAYTHNRGNDALDVVEAGVTFSKKPGFSLYVGFLNVVPLGYSDVDGTLYGIAHREAGALPMRHNAAGVLLWGEEQLGYMDFSPDDPASPESWRVGVIGLVQGRPLPQHEILNCPKLLHLGWVGLALNCHLAELADFLLGWAGVDIMGDDTAGRTEAAAGEEESHPPPVSTLR